MRTFRDWLEYYNNLDVAPFLEALQKMKEFYTDLGVDIFKDAVSLPGVSKQYLLRKTLQPRRGYKPPELYVPNKEAYAMLKAAVVGGSFQVFKFSCLRQVHRSGGAAEQNLVHPR